MSTRLVWNDLEIGRALGAGRAGEVLAASLRRDVGELAKDTEVAVKCYKSWVLEQRGQYDRILRELEVGRRIVHPNLVLTYGLVHTPSGAPALVMKRYEGDTLDKHIKKNPALHITDALELLRQVGSALSALHQAHVLHRDIKPSNIIVAAHGAVLLDLGVVLADSVAHENTTLSFLGTIRYAAPEYLFGEPFTAAADVYALGAIAFELVTRQPFFDESIQWAQLVVAKLLGDHARRTAQVNVALPKLTPNAIRQLTQASNRRTASFLTELILRMTGPSDDRPNLQHIVQCLEERIWRRPFHLAQGVFAKGYPWTSDGVPITKQTFQRSVAQWQKILPKSEWDYLVTVARAAFEGRVFTVYATDTKTAETLQARRFITIEDDGHDRYATPHLFVALAYRDGMMDRPSKAEDWVLPLSYNIKHIEAPLVRHDVEQADASEVG